ncbi:RNA polymerase sigma-F factor [Caloramator mitchellensis]|uniref:RNA polymerase sigma factor n=1 Tax=Caloramator mitchellensis TaxID=908809 RepID=A0A0R3K245_CALMK|nr:RNA polymerase sporulation sigma factor SigF [Caloramator mitchellensis]KRQ87476.1 RNA polymerase sigma-F factor [Caloramator mitchellensis]
MAKDSPMANIYENQDELLNMIKRSQKGDQSAQDLIVKSNLGLVSMVVKKFLNRGYEYDDLFQIGCIGLIKAIKHFNPEFNVKFSTYAVPMILGEVKRFLRDDGIIKVSRNMKETARKVKLAKERLAIEFGREATIEEISKELSITSEDVVMCLDSLNAPEYLYDTIHHDDGSPVLLIDKVSEDKEIDVDDIDKIALKEVINRLEPRQRQIILLRYFKDMTQNQVAEMLGISQVQVSRIEKKIIKYLREIMK